MAKHVVIVDGNYQGILSVPAAKRLGYRVTFITSATMHKFYDRPDLPTILAGVDETVQIADSTDDKALTDVIRDVHARHPVDGLLTTHDFCVVPLAIAAERTGLSFTARGAVETARDKGRCREVLREKGLRSTPFEVAKGREEVLRAAEALGYPLVIKPLSGVGGILVALVRSQAELEAYLTEATAARSRLKPHQALGVSDRFILEEFVPGKMLQVEIAVRGGEMVPIMISDGKRSPRNPILSLGTNMPARLSDAATKSVIDYCRTVVAAIGFDLGIFHIELALTADGPCLIEFNPRLMGSSLPKLFKHVTGVDIFELLVQIYCRDVDSIGPFQYRNCASSRPIASWNAANIRTALPSDWMGPYRPRLLEYDIDAKAGQEIRPLRSMYDFIGYVQVSSDTPDGAAAEADHVVREIGQSLGFDAAL